MGAEPAVVKFITVIPYIQFDVTNTLNDQLLENVRVEMEEVEGFSVVSYVPVAKLPYDKPGTTYTLVELTDPNSVTGTFLNTLKFVVKDCDPNTGEPDDDVGYDDEYVVSNGALVNLHIHCTCVQRGNYAYSAEWPPLPSTVAFL